VSSTSLVRYKDTDYSVPVRYGYQDVFIKAYVDCEWSCKSEPLSWVV
jgi:hypothetical protein